MLGKYMRKVGGLFLAAILLPCLVLVWSNTKVEAQRRVIVVSRPIYRPFYRPWGWRRPFGYDPYLDYYGRYGQYIFTSSDAAYSGGYRSGLKTGVGDVKHHRSYDPQRSHYFQEAGFGNFGEVYRSGFVRGYAAGYRS